MALPSDILKQVDQVTLGYTAKAFQTIVSSHMTELRLMLVAYIALFGIAVLQGSLSMTLRDASKHILKALIIFQLATNWGTFTTFFYNVFNSGPEKLTTALIGGKDPTQQLEDVFVTGVEAARKINRKAGTFDVAQVFLAVLVLIGTVFMTGIALFLLVLSKMGLAILLSIAPVFIALALWKSTQGLFQGWVNYLVNYAMIPVITYALLGLILQLMRDPVDQIKQAGENLTMVTIIPYLLMGAIAVLLFSQVLRISASLGGGVALSTMGAFTRYISRPVSAVGRQLASRPSGGRSLASASQERSVSSSSRPNTLITTNIRPKTPSNLKVTHS
ncbi:MAG: type IV secretion system protein [Deltaproteobacteria bacterium]|nr:type IV secretion system protein [Deltaproteobacteria bacterium]